MGGKYQSWEYKEKERFKKELDLRLPAEEDEQRGGAKEGEGREENPRKNLEKGDMTCLITMAEAWQ